VTLTPDDVELSQEVREGWGVAAEGGVTVALDLTITPELRQEGLARELVRVIQDARKAAGLQVSDRIALGVEAEGELATALDRHADHVMAETLATSLERSRLSTDEPTGNVYANESSVDGSPVRITLTRKTGERGAR
jgi:isoleucyl-tRNA synthetase